LSTILKALRRLEEERTAKAERALREQVVGASPGAPGHWRRLVLGGLGAVAAVALVSLALHSWLARSPAKSAASPTAPAAPPAAAAAANPLAAAPRPPRGVPPTAAPSPAPQAAPPVAPAASPPTGTGAPPGALQGVQRPAPAELRAAAAALAPRADVAVVQRPPPSPQVPDEGPPVNEPPQTQRAAPEPGSVPPSPRMAPAAAAAGPSSAGEDAATSSVPIRLREIDPTIHSPYGIHEDTPKKLPTHAKAAHPHAGAPASEVVVTRTIWHPNAERRVALVLGAGDSQAREVHEGESVGSLQVLRIEPSDVVFLRDGVEVRQRVGASR
jgi:hypothetical protein